MVTLIQEAKEINESTESKKIKDKIHIFQDAIGIRI
jgi:hypothetical protein